MNVSMFLARCFLIASAPLNARGFNRFMKLINGIFPASASEEHIQDLGDGARFAYPSGDQYWLYAFLHERSYEPELKHLLARLPTAPGLFLDCGANFGYWSVVASKTIKTVAVEASSRNFPILAKNSELNDNRFLTLHAAISDGSADFVLFSTDAFHSDNRITDDPANSERINAVSIDSLVAKHGVTDKLTVVKLDVEFAEILAFRGAIETLKGNSIFFYEDHGVDPISSVTRFLMEDRSRRIFFISDDGVVYPIADPTDTYRFKPSRTRGYNFVALGDHADASIFG